MKSVVDVAAFILDEYGTMTTMKLQKLAYYSQAYCLSPNGPLFEEDFQAWMNGPVVPELYREHRGRFLIRRGGPRPRRRGARAPERFRETARQGGLRRPLRPQRQAALREDPRRGSVARRAQGLRPVGAVRGRHPQGGHPRVLHGAPNRERRIGPAVRAKGCRPLLTQAQRQGLAPLRTPP